MDISTNAIDFRYLANPHLIQRMSKSPAPRALDDNTLHLYRKRIFKVTKELLQGKRVNPVVDNIFEDYALACIKYLKFQDMSKSVQGDYKDYCPPKNSKVGTLDISKSNRLILRGKCKKPRITDHIAVKRSKRPSPPVVIPKQRSCPMKEQKFSE